MKDSKTPECIMIDNRSLKVRGIKDEKKAQIICALLLGGIELTEEIDEADYCQELKDILERGYFEVEYLDGVFKRRVEVPRDWKPKKYDWKEHCPPVISLTKSERIKEWFCDYWGHLLGLGGFLLGICGLFLALFL